MKSYKGYKEMTRCVLEARDEYLRKKKKRQLYFKRSVPAVLSFCFIAVLLSFNHGKVSMPRIPDETQISDISTITVEVTETETAQLTTAASTSKVKTAITTTIKNTIPHEKETKISETTVYTATQETENQVIVSQEPEQTELQSENNITTVQTSVQQETKATTTEQPVDAPPVTTSDNVSDASPNNETPLPWDERNLGQKYFFAEFGSVTESYSTANKTVSDADIGDYIADAYMSGYDDETQTYYHCYAKAYLIKGKTEKEMIAIQFEESNEYYVYSYNQLSE